MANQTAMNDSRVVLYRSRKPAPEYRKKVPDRLRSSEASVAFRCTGRPVTLYCLVMPCALLYPVVQCAIYDLVIPVVPQARVVTLPTDKLEVSDPPADFKVII